MTMKYIPPSTLNGFSHVGIWAVNSARIGLNIIIGLYEAT